jgi:hypothetical protein
LTPLQYDKTVSDQPPSTLVPRTKISANDSPLRIGRSLKLFRIVHPREETSETA